MVNGQQTGQSWTRILRGVLLFAFAAAAILPFCTAFFLCAMPCCHGGGPPSAGITAPMPACPGSPTDGCATEISAAVERTASTAPAPGPVQMKLSIAAATTLAPQVAAVRLPDEAPPPAAGAPLHVLNSVFRI